MRCSIKKRMLELFSKGLLFRCEKITPLSSSYNISGLVPVCWLLFQKFDNFGPVRGLF